MQQGADIGGKVLGYAYHGVAKVEGETQDVVHSWEEHVGSLFQDMESWQCYGSDVPSRMEGKAMWYKMLKCGT